MGEGITLGWAILAQCIERSEDPVFPTEEYWKFGVSSIGVGKIFAQGLEKLFSLLSSSMHLFFSNPCLHLYSASWKISSLQP